MDANTFEYFCAVARSGSISRGAGELGMEPSTLTRHIGRLEEEVGVKLFHRSGRGMVLTDAGTLLLEEATKVGDTLQRARRVAADLAAEGPSTIVVAAQPTIAQVCFGPMAHALRESFPRARMRFTEGFGHEVVEWLQQGQVDIALLYVPSRTPIVEYEFLLQEPLHCILPAGYPLPPLPFHSFQAIDLPLVLPSTAHGLRALAEGWAQKQGKRVKLAMECDGSTFITRRLVQGGHGCTILPLASVQEDVERGLLQAVPMEGADALRTVALATAQNRSPVTGLAQVTRLLREVVARLVATGQWPGVERMAS